jgi:hypothetical protein
MFFKMLIWMAWVKGLSGLIKMGRSVSALSGDNRIVLIEVDNV